MIKKRIELLRSKFKEHKIDGYIIPKNDEFFSAYSKNDRLKTISNFSGSAGYAIVLKSKNYLFVDGRYTLQANIESGKNFKINDFEKIFNCTLFKNLNLGLDPKLFTSYQIKNFFLKYNKIKFINKNLIDEIHGNYKAVDKPFYSLNEKIVGESSNTKILKIKNILNKVKSNFLFISAPENIAWLLNIRGFDNPFSPIPNCRLLISKKAIFIICEKKKLKKLIKLKKIKKKEIIDPKEFDSFFKNISGNKIIIDKNTCSVHYENILKKNFKTIIKDDPIYFLKSIKNKTEIKNMINAHIADGVALTKFIFWIKNINKKKITEVDAQNKLESLRKLNDKYLFPSFNTIAGSGKNGAIVHYRATKKNTKFIKKDEIFLCDSGGQYKYGTTDVTRTLCFSNPSEKIKEIFTKVLKGHIAVVSADLDKHKNGKLIDKEARKFLKKEGLDYSHGTGHGVGFFLNVHEGPQAISKNNLIKIREGMILSNEPGYYKKNNFGIRIENLIYVSKINKKINFQNLTMVPIEKDLINFKLLTKKEKNYLFKYHLETYTKLAPYLNKVEKKWLASFI